MPKFWPWSWMLSIWQPWTMKSGHFYGYKKPLLWWFERAQGKSKSQKPFPFFKLSIVKCFRRTGDVSEGQGKVKNCPPWLLWPFISVCCYLHCGSNLLKKGIFNLIPNYVRQLYLVLLMSFDIFCHYSYINLRRFHIFYCTKCHLISKWVFSILPKNEQKKIQIYYYDTSGRLVFVRFLGEIEDTKKTFRN